MKTEDTLCAREVCKHRRGVHAGETGICLEQECDCDGFSQATVATFEEKAAAIVAEDRRTVSMTLDELLAEVRKFAVIGCGGDPKSLASIAARRILRLCDTAEEYGKIIQRARQVISVNHLEQSEIEKRYMACVRWILFEDDPEVEREWGYDV